MHLRLLSSAVLSLAFLAVPSASGSQTSSRSGTATCALITTSEAADVLGIMSTHVEHAAVTARSCSWASTDPNCFMRVLSVERSTVAKFGSEQWLATDLPPGSMFSNDVYPAGSSLAIEYLDVPTGNAWLHFSLLGRVDRVAAQQMLSSLALAILQRSAT
jgi:hypothetical protein